MNSVVILSQDKYLYCVEEKQKEIGKSKDYRKLERI